MAEISLREYCEQIDGIIEQGRYAEAVAHSKHILKEYPKNVAAYRLLGKAMLEADEDDDAFDMFHRVLGVDPEDLVAWVGISEIYNRRDELKAAVWHLERAFEVASDNEVGIVEEELRHLYGRRDGVEPERVQLTRGALARLYLKGDLLSRAIREFRALLAEQPERVDLSVALAEALWRDGRRLEAVDVCQQVLDKYPYSLKANLILGEIWSSSGREEGQAYLQRAEAVDPQNEMAQELFRAASPLPTREVSIVPLEYEPEVAEERPAWMADVEAVPGAAPPEVEREAPSFGVTAGIEAPIEIPSWLEELGEEEMAAAAPAEPPEEARPEEAVPTAEEEIPEWLVGLREGLGEEEAAEVGEEEAEEVVEEEVPEWLTGLDIEPTAMEMEEEAPEALAEPDVEAVSEEAVPSAPPAELPEDWLDGLREQMIEEGELPEEPTLPTAEEAPTPTWLEGEEMPSGEEALAWLEQLTAGKEAELGALAEEEAEARMAAIMGRPEPAEAVGAPPGEAPSEVTGVPPEEEEAPAPPTEEPVAAVEEAPPVEEAAPAVEEAGAPAWLEGEEMPSGEEALAWLEQLTAGKEAELGALAEEEAEARMAAIMGRPEPAEVPSEVTGAPPVEEAVPEETVAPAVEEPFGWTAFEEPEAPAPVEEVEEVLPAEEEAEAPLEVTGAPPGEAPLEVTGAPPIEEAIPEAPVAPRVEEPFGWTAFEELEAPPVAEVGEAPPVEEAAAPEMPEAAYAEEVEFPAAPEFAPAEEVPTAEVAPPIEEARWGAEWEAPEAEVAPTPVVEEVPGVTEMEAPAPIEEPTAAVEEAPAVEAPAIEEAYAEPLDDQRAYVKEHRRDYDAWLALARALWQADERQEALEAYSRVVRGGKLLDGVIADMEAHVEAWPDPSAQRVLGDAYMKDGQLQEALDIYRRALETL